MEGHCSTSQSPPRAVEPMESEEEEEEEEDKWRGRYGLSVTSLFLCYSVHHELSCRYLRASETLFELFL